MKTKKHLFNGKKGSLIMGIALLLVVFTSGMVQAQNQYTPESGSEAYAAAIHEINPNLTEDDVSGAATFIVANGKLHVSIAVKGLEPSMMHLQHIHGFKMSDEESSCPTAAADKNNDGIIDLIETHKASGVTLIPFNKAPANLKILSSSYPVANSEGLLTYRMSIPLSKLKTAVQQKYGIEELSLEDRVIYIHGVRKEASLPESVQSLPGVPSQVTVPLACGEIEEL